MPGLGDLVQHARRSQASAIAIVTEDERLHSGDLRSVLHKVLPSELSVLIGDIRFSTSVLAQ